MAGERERWARIGGRSCLGAPAVVAAALTLTGCDPVPRADTPQEQAGLPYEQSSKLASYYRFTNGLDLVALRKSFADQDAGHAKAGDDLFIDHGTLESAATELDTIRRESGVLGSIDTGADRLLATLRRAEQRAGGLDSYFRMRGYLTDNYRRARQEHAAMLSAYDDAIAAFTPFAAAVEQAQARQELVYLQRMQDEKRPQDIVNIQLVRHARKIRAVTADRDALKTPTGAAQADRAVAALLPLLDRGRTAWSAALAKPENDRPTDNSFVLSQAEQMIGAYRKFQGSGADDDYDQFRRAVTDVIIAGD